MNTQNTTATKAQFRQQVNNLFYDGLLTISQKQVLMVLATFLGEKGLFPAHATIAKASNRSVRTVIRALERAYQLGIVIRQHRTAQIGSVRRKISNVYQLVISKAQQGVAQARHLMRGLYDKAAHKVPNQESLPLFRRRYPQPQENPRDRNQLLEWLASLKSG